MPLDWTLKRKDFASREGHQVQDIIRACQRVWVEKFKMVGTKGKAAALHWTWNSDKLPRMERRADLSQATCRLPDLSSRSSSKICAPSGEIPNENSRLEKYALSVQLDRFLLRSPIPPAILAKPNSCHGLFSLQADRLDAAEAESLDCPRSRPSAAAFCCRPHSAEHPRRTSHCGIAADSRFGEPARDE